MGHGYRVEDGIVLSEDIPRIRTRLDAAIEMYGLYDIDDSLRRIKENELENGKEEGKTIVDTLSSYLVSKLYSCARELVKEYDHLFSQELTNRLLSINESSS